MYFNCAKRHQQICTVTRKDKGYNSLSFPLLYTKIIILLLAKKEACPFAMLCILSVTSYARPDHIVPPLFYNLYFLKHFHIEYTNISF